MKVKCPKFKDQYGYCLRDEECPVTCEEHGFIDGEVSTADLIAELEQRRPCEKCKCDKRTEPDCCSCFFDVDNRNNFSPINTKETK